MSEQTFYKCACPACGGHIEFPAEYVGDKVPCPHCLAEVVLVQSLERKGRPLLRITAASLAILVLATAAFWVFTARRKPVVTPIDSTDSHPVLPSPPTPSTNELALSHPDLSVVRYELKKAKEGGLQFVVGSISNRSAAQYFSLKVEFDLFKADGQSAGTASDLLSDLAPHAAWNFRATVLEKGVTRVKLVKVSGEKE
jgi:hypothetical protein